ncbi:hypothetical protein F4777DRAFT_421042 [Nemania sp. FL0916]|nr:hypothetical protein F4777DRAFT_421042 [Nemania sp. FL0916]
MLIPGLRKAAVLLAPALDLVSAGVLKTISSGDDITTSHSLITLQPVGKLNHNALLQTTLDFRVFESHAPCGLANVTLNGESLTQDDIGFGSGSIPTDSDGVLAADWKFTCVHLQQDSQVQLLSVHVVSIDGQEVDNTAFSVQFQQVAPVSILQIDGARTKLDSSLNSSPPPSLEHQLAELDKLKKQLLELERSIASKITHISESFDLSQTETLLQSDNCQGVKCFFNTVFDRLKAAASRLYHGQQEPSESATSNPGNPHWAGYGDQRPLTGTDGAEKSDSTTSWQDSGRGGPQHKANTLISVSGNGTGDETHRIRRIGIVAIIALTVVSNLIMMVILYQCVTLLHRRRKARWEKRRDRIRKSREDCNALVATKYIDLIQWLRDSLGREDVVTQEKDAIMRQIHRPESDEESSDSLSITMEEEIARFRAAANMVGNLVSAEGGRGRSQLAEHLSFTRPRRASSPLSITSSCPTYRSVDESLPAYDENRSPDYVVDGFQFTPSGSTSGTSSPRSPSPMV